MRVGLISDMHIPKVAQELPSQIADDPVTVKGITKDKIIEDTATRLVLDVCLENQNS